MYTYLSGAHYDVNFVSDLIETWTNNVERERIQIMHCDHRLHASHTREKLALCRKWIWIGIGFNVFDYLLMTQLTALCLRLLHPPEREAVIVPKEQLIKDIEYAFSR
jgi:hypothetical protein